jgi:hypothetical protein
LHQIDDKFRKQSPVSKKSPVSKIRAIGILGGDVFDKLLILRALRPEFPEALFFTTDFDEAFTIKSELPFTRNLIISSSFGPNLNDKLQLDIPFFRDSYETSAFLATKLATGDWTIDENRWDISSSQLAERLRVPQIFEIERTGHVLSFEGKAVPRAVPLPPSDDIPCPKTLGSCNPRPLVADNGYPHQEGRSDVENDFRPRADDLFPTFEESRRNTLALGLAGGALFGLASLCFPAVRKSAWVEVCLGVLGLGAGAWICTNWEPVAQHLTENGNGEPIIILEGVSVWPTVLMRGLGLILALYFIFWRGLPSLHRNLAEIADEMQLDPKPVPLPKQFTGVVDDIISAWKKIVSVWKKITGRFNSSDKNKQMTQSSPHNAKAIWEAYVARERLWPRCIRAALCTAVMFGFYMYVLKPIFGGSMPPVRGVLAHKLYHLTIRFDVILMEFLIFFVFDATLSCLFLVNKLRSSGHTLWPLITMWVYKDRLRLQTKLVHDWIDLDFVAKRTHCIGSLIYYPFVLIALLIVSRSRVFADYPPSLTILTAQGISLSVVFGCAFMLWWSAKAARDTAKQHLTDGIIRAKDKEGNVYLAGQLEALLNRVDQLNDGAFRPFSQQPLVRALLFPLSSAGGIALIENGMLPGL